MININEFITKTEVASALILIAIAVFYILVRREMHKK